MVTREPGWRPNDQQSDSGAPSHESTRDERLRAVLETPLEGQGDEALLRRTQAIIEAIDWYPEALDDSVLLEAEQGAKEVAHRGPFEQARFLIWYAEWAGQRLDGEDATVRRLVRDGAQALELSALLALESAGCARMMRKLLGLSDEESLELVAEVTHPIVPPKLEPPLEKRKSKGETGRYIQMAEGIIKNYARDHTLPDIFDDQDRTQAFDKVWFMNELDFVRAGISQEEAYRALIRLYHREDWHETKASLSLDELRIYAEAAEVGGRSSEEQARFILRYAYDAPSRLDEDDWVVVELLRRGVQKEDLHAILLRETVGFAEVARHALAISDEEWQRIKREVRGLEQ